MLNFIEFGQDYLNSQGQPLKGFLETEISERYLNETVFEFGKPTQKNSNASFVAGAAASVPSPAVTNRKSMDLRTHSLENQINLKDHKRTPSTNVLTSSRH